MAEYRDWPTFTPLGPWPLERGHVMARSIASSEQRFPARDTAANVLPHTFERQFVNFLVGVTLCTSFRLQRNKRAT